MKQNKDEFGLELHIAKTSGQVDNGNVSMKFPIIAACQDSAREQEYTNSLMAYLLNLN